MDPTKDKVIHPIDVAEERPTHFTYPHCYTPHPLTLIATGRVKSELTRHLEWKDEISRGKMFGVLVCEQADGSLCFLAAFSGTLDGKTIHPFFVEPVYDLMQEGSYFKEEEKEISQLIAQSKKEMEEGKKSKLTAEAKQRSIALQRWLFSQYNFLNIKGETATTGHIFGTALPPSGTGDCCAPKLLQAAFRRKIKPLCMGEFWMGQSPKEELRIEGNFYPACSAKCKPLLCHMLLGMDVEPNPLLQTLSEPLSIIYQDEEIVVINKPSGMLSVPGKDALPNVQDEIRNKFPEATGPLIVHRLDMDTSGIMVLALTEEAYHRLQEQFIQHKTQKRYIALLEHEMPIGTKGRIDLPICPDITDRPRQMVNYEYGKRSITEYEVIGEKDGHAIVQLSPHTGRTHQLRVHSAHTSGLNNPIVGDRLYGKPGTRLCLHAELLSFTHPSTLETMTFETGCDFFSHSQMPHIT